MFQRVSSKIAGEATKFHRLWQGPFKIIKQMTKVTYLVKKGEDTQGGRKCSFYTIYIQLYDRKLAEVSRGAATDAVWSLDGEETEMVEGECEHVPHKNKNSIKKRP